MCDLAMIWATFNPIHKHISSFLGALSLLGQMSLTEWGEGSHRGIGVPRAVICRTKGRLSGDMLLVQLGETPPRAGSLQRWLLSTLYQVVGSPEVPHEVY